MTCEPRELPVDRKADPTPQPPQEWFPLSGLNTVLPGFQHLPQPSTAYMAWKTWDPGHLAEMTTAS